MPSFVLIVHLRFDTIDENGVWHGAALIVSEFAVAHVPTLYVLTTLQHLTLGRFMSLSLPSPTSGTQTVSFPTISPDSKRPQHPLHPT